MISDTNKETDHKLKIKANRFIDTDSIEYKLKIVLDSFRTLESSVSDVSKEASAAAASLYEQLKETKYRFFHVIDSIDDLIIVKDGEGCWRTVNLFTQQLLNLKSEEYIGKTNSEIIKLIPKQTGFITKCKVTDIEVWNKQGPMRFVETITVDDETYYFDIIKTPVYNEDGSKRELIVVGRDITNIKKQELIVSTYTSALSSTKDVVLIVNKAKKILYYNNDNFLDFFDLIHKTEYSFTDIMNSFSEEVYDKLWANVLNNYPYFDTVDLVVNDKKRKTLVSAIPLVIKTLPEYFIIILKKFSN